MPIKSVMMMSLNLYGRIDGIETSKKIRTQFDIPNIVACRNN